MQRCTHCDHFNSEEATQCERCGAPVGANADTQDGDSSSASGAEDGGFVQEILSTAKNHGKISAIKQYREATGVGLKEAKEAVEAMMLAHNVTASTSSSGCAGVVAVLLILPALVCALIQSSS